MGRPVRLGPRPMAPGRVQGERVVYLRDNQQNCVVVYAELYIGPPSSASKLIFFFSFLNYHAFIVRRKGSVQVMMWPKIVNANILD